MWWSRLQISGVRHAFFQDHPFTAPRPWRWAVMRHRPEPSGALDAPLASVRSARGWAWAHDPTQPLDADTLAHPPYDLLADFEPVVGWAVSTVVESSVKVSYEGRPHHLVFAFEHDDQVWCGSWVVDYSGFYQDDSDELTALVTGWSPGTPVVVLLPGGEPVGAVPWRGLKVVPRP